MKLLDIFFVTRKMEQRHSACRCDTRNERTWNFVASEILREEEF